MVAALLTTLTAGSLVVRSPGTASRSSATRCAVSLSLTLSQPSQSEAESLGVRDWPQTATSSELVDECADGALRYVLEGTGSVCADGDEPVAVAVNTLVRVDSATTLRWVPDGDELVLLTPEYKGPNLVPFAAGFVVLMVGLVAVAGGG